VRHDVRVADGQPVIREGPVALAAARVVVLHKRDRRGRPPAASSSRLAGQSHQHTTVRTGRLG
jgi:hypothetical protein